MTDLIHIREARPADRNSWQSLWKAYNDFYASSVPDETTESAWRRILDINSPIYCLVAEDSSNGSLAGFIHYVVHPRTWHVQDCCYLEDLYVDENARGRGIGRKLCMELKTLCAAKGLSRIYWHTHESNVTARKLYDQIAVKDDFVRYIMVL